MGGAEATEEGEPDPSGEAGDLEEGRGFFRTGDGSPAMKFRLIEAERAAPAILRLCQVIGVTRAGYYAWKGRGTCQRGRDDRELRRLIREVFAGSFEIDGAPRSHAERRAMGLAGLSRWPKRPIWSSGASRPARPTSSGWRISPTSPPPKVGSSWGCCWTCSAVGSWAGPCATTSKPSW